ncbi:MAG: YidC/Oxa1 family insertase periplasmic-domain containing protein [Puniceicoccales bacterium]|jgi:YidC/Oxa1 family membrane protein insertase|nr:YidC/Oxa1 family insertase periplasmic-domain containing protein [Puniceicoccales bacterium]
MDKKFLFLGISSLLLAAVLMLGESRKCAAPTSAAEEIVAVAQNPTAARRAAKERIPRSNDRPLILENDFVRVAISPTGGGIRSIAMLRYAASLGSADPWIFDDYDSVQDALTAQIIGESGAISLATIPFDAVESTSRSVLLRGKLPDGGSVERSYCLCGGDDGGDPYDLRQKISIVAGGGAEAVELSLGSLPSTNGNVCDHLKFVSYDGKRTHFTPMGSFSKSNGLFGLWRREKRETIGRSQPMAWVAIKNHFFAAILKASLPATAALCYPIDIGELSASGLGGSATIPLVSGGGASSVDFSYYVGPLEYMRLDRLGGDRERVMEFGFFGFFGKLLLFALLGIHAAVPNWGWAIIALTVAVKLLLWPLAYSQARSSKKMASIQKPLKEIQRRHRSNPKKSQEETLKLFRENGVNPAAGCLPLLVQIPIFFGLYSMLRSASELRFAKFLWIGDLSSADTVARFGALPINPLPFLMGASMFLQMRHTPMPTQSAGQRWLFLAMPIICTAFCYNFPAGLVLYWTVQNCVGIGQQLLIQKKMKKAEVASAAATAKRGDARGRFRRRT